MIGISIIGIFLAVQHFKTAKNVAVLQLLAQLRKWEIEDDEF